MLSSTFSAVFMDGRADICLSSMFLALFMDENPFLNLPSTFSAVFMDERADFVLSSTFLPFFMDGGQNNGLIWRGGQHMRVSQTSEDRHFSPNECMTRRGRHPACSCRLHKINFFDYLSDILNRTDVLQQSATPEAYRDILPDRWKKNEQGQ